MGDAASPRAGLFVRPAGTVDRANPSPTASSDLLVDVSRLCFQGSGVSVPHLVTGCVTRRPYRDGRRVVWVEIGHVRLHTIQHSPAPRGFEEPDGRLRCYGAGFGCHSVRRDYGADSTGFSP